MIGNPKSRLTACFAILMLSLAASVAAFADEGECGLEAGLWAKSPAICTLLQQSKPNAADDSAWLEWQRGHYVYQGVTCAIFSSKVTGASCHLSIECSRVMGEFDIKIASKREMTFGADDKTDRFIHCGKAGP